MSKFNLCAFADEADSKLDGQIAALKANGIGYLEIRGVDGKNISAITADEAKTIKSRLDDAGIAVWSIGSPTGKIDIKKPFDKHLDEFCHMIELAHILGASHYRLFSFYGTDGAASYEDAVLERLNRFVEKSKGSGVVLCHENEKDIYGDVAERCLAIHQKIPEIKAIFDPSNFIQCKVDVPAAWNMLKEYVEYIHVKDAKANGGVVPAGHGVGNLSAIIKEFGSRGGGTLSLEPHLHFFKGFGKLQALVLRRGKEFVYNTQREAFDAASDALKVIINEIED